MHLVINSFFFFWNYVSVIAGGPGSTVIIKSVDSLKHSVTKRSVVYLKCLGNIAHSCMNFMNVVWHGVGHIHFPPLICKHTQEKDNWSELLLAYVT